MLSNLPPGVTEGMIPGNRPEDLAWEKFHEEVDENAFSLNLSDQDALVAWKMGIGAFQAAREFQAKFPHDGPEPDIADPCPEEKSR